MLSFAVLGPIEVIEDEVPLDIGGPRQRRLLSSLIAASGRVVSVDRLCEQVWSDRDRPDGAAQAVRSYVARLRRALGRGAETVLTAPPGYAFEPGEHEVDAQLAEMLYSHARAFANSDSAVAVELLEQASDLWRGDAYGEFSDLEWLVAECQRLRELRRAIVEALFEARLATGQGAELVSGLERAVRDFPLSERLRGHLMQALWRSGRAADALRTFQHFREYLAEETGLEPGFGLRQVEADIIEGTPEMADQESMRTSRRTRPEGTVTFLFGDVEGSTRLWADDAGAMAASLRTCEEILRSAVESTGGHLLTPAGDEFRAVFHRASDAVGAALDAQDALPRASWPGPALRVRLALYLGEAEERGGLYIGSAVDAAARLAVVGHGGQVLITEAVRLASSCTGTVDLGSFRLRDVAEPMHLHQLNPGHFPPLRIAPEDRSTLPIPLTPLIGREEEIRKVRGLLLDHRLVTLTGVGGCGKTRIAIEIAERELTKLEHGAYFADLSVVTSDADVVRAVAEAVRFTLVGNDPLGHLLTHLAGKRVLVILDNCEHVIDACADFAAAVLSRSGDWRLLATSREYLDVAGEQVFQVPSLAVDNSGAAVELFRVRAAELDADFVFDNRVRDTVAELCERLDGMPLAIELAAARTAVMSPEEILSRIDDRFHVLSGGRRRSRQRRRTLEATLDWSFDLLDNDEQALLVSLGVFMGPFDLASAAAVATLPEFEALDLLESLITKSLVTMHTAGGTTVYRLLETVRAYAEERLDRAGALAVVRDRHLACFADAVRAAAATVAAAHGAPTTSHRDAWQRLLRLKANLDAAIDWAIACRRFEDAALILALAVQVWREYHMDEKILDSIELVTSHIETPELEDRLLVPQMVILLRRGEDQRLRRLLDRAVDSDVDDVRQSGLVMSANIEVARDPAKALEIADRLASDPAADWIRAIVHMIAGDSEQALRLLLPQGSWSGEEGWLTDGAIAACLLMTGQPAEALEIVEGHSESDSIWRPFGIIVGLCHLALGDRPSAERLILTEVEAATLGRLPRLAASALVGLAALVHHDGDAEWASEIILEAGDPQTTALMAVGRFVAEQIGVRDQFVTNQLAAMEEDSVDVTGFLKATLFRWEALHDGEREGETAPSA